MRYLALATDYGGIIADDGAVDKPTLSPLDICGLLVAVTNAVTAVKERAAFVTTEYPWRQRRLVTACDGLGRVRCPRQAKTRSSRRGLRSRCVNAPDPLIFQPNSMRSFAAPRQNRRRTGPIVDAAANSFERPPTLSGINTIQTVIRRQDSRLIQ
jgi:hypothetical protein